jgi:protocatechuate 3,4-dioxygenase beta subunit
MPLSSKSKIILLVLTGIMIGAVSISRIGREKPKDAARSETMPRQQRIAEHETKKTELPLIIPYPAVAHPPVRARLYPNQSNDQDPLQERAQVEVCYIDKETQQAIIAGKIAIGLENADSPIFSAEIGEDGRNYLEMDPGKYKIRMDSSGYSRQDETIEVFSRLDRIRKTIQLSRTIAVRGIVRNFKGRPQEGADVELFQDGFRASAKTGTTGEFEALLRIQPIRKIIAHHPPHPIAELGPISLDESTIPYLEITLPKDADVVLLKGKVLDDEGSPIKKAAVEVHTSSRYAISDSAYQWMEPWLQLSQTRSDSDGAFSFELPRPCKAWLTVIADNLEPYRETLQISSDTEIKVFLLRHPQFEVKVRDIEGHEISGISIMGLSPAGKEVVHEAPESGAYYATEYPFTIFGRGISNNLGFTKGLWINQYQNEIILESGQWMVRGKVIDQTGSPVKAFNVFVTYKNDETYKGYLLFRADFPDKFYDEDGLFIVKNLVPGKATITVTANAADGEWEPFSRDMTVTDQRGTIIQVALNKKW